MKNVVNISIYIDHRKGRRKFEKIENKRNQIDHNIKHKVNIFKKNWRNTFQSDGPVFDSILKGKNLEGLEHYLPLFFGLSSSDN